MVYDPVKRKERYEKNKEKVKELYEKNKEQIKEQRKDYYEKNKEKRHELYEKNKEKLNEYNTKRWENLRQHAKESIIDKITDRKKWDMWCDKIKSDAKNNQHPYSDDFTNDVIFDMMNQGCFYCGDVATTIDRIDSKLEHTIDNCVGCCKGCNISKGNADISTFIGKAYYRVHKKYYDDSDIWFVHKKKPRMCEYKSRADKQGVPFELTHENFYTLTKGDCVYCHRSPSTWFGIDKIIPSLGYVIGNVASCCYDCNVDKLDDDVDITMMRNERIADRVDTGELVIVDCEKVILHTGIRKSSKTFN